jgi:hypothetical protein
LSHFYEHGSRSCEVTQLAADFSSGTYDCALNGDFVSYGFSATPATQIYTKGNDWYCQDTLGGGYDDLEEIPDLQYSYSWTGNCKSPLTCDVTIVNRMSMNTSMYSAITIEAFAEGTTDDPDGNPFAEDQDLIINRLLVTKFAPKGKAKVLAICEAFPAVGTVTFHTSLDPVTPQ